MECCHEGCGENAEGVVVNTAGWCFPTCRGHLGPGHKSPPPPFRVSYESAAPLAVPMEPAVPDSRSVLISVEDAVALHVMEGEA